MTYVAMFDLDGTLIDTPTAIVDAFTAAFIGMGVEAPDPAAIRATIGLPLQRAFMDLLATHAADPRLVEGSARYQEAFRKFALPRAPELIFPGVVAGLTKLRRLGISLAVATNKYRTNAEALLHSAGIRDFFGLVVGADQVGRPKPDPETAQLILATFQAAPSRAVVIGDTTFDIQMANAAGITSVAVTYGVHDRAELVSATPTRVADTFEDVLAAIQAAYRKATFHPMEICHHARYDDAVH